MRSDHWLGVVIVAAAAGMICSGLAFGQGSGGVDPSMLAAKEAKAAAFEAARLEKVPPSKPEGPANPDPDGLGSVAGLPDCCPPNGTCMAEVFPSDCEDVGGFVLPEGSCNSGRADCTPSDDCPGDEIPVGGSVISSTVGATVDSGIPACGTSITAPGVWYRVIGNGNTLTATTCNDGTFYDTKISVFCSDCELPLCIGGNDDGGTGCELPSGAPWESRVTWCSQAGTEYHILVHGFGGAAGPFQLDILDGGPCDDAACCECCGGVEYVESTCDNEFEDISATGTQSNPTSECDDCGELVSIGFTFEFFGDSHTDVSISSNGYLTFGTSVADFSNDPIPTADPPNDFIAPLWNDWDTFGLGRVVHYQTLGAPGSRRLIVQCTNVETCCFSGDSNTFQAVLFEGSNCIEFRYLDITPELAPGDYTAGVEHRDGVVGTAIDTSMVESGDCIRLCPVPCEEEPAQPVLVDMDLTLLPVGVDLRQENEGPSITKAKFDIWNQDERRFSGTERCVSCWDQTLLSRYDAPNHFLIHNLHTDKGRARIDGVGSALCEGSLAHPLLGLAIKVITFPGRPPQIARSAVVPRGSGAEAATIKYDLVPTPDEAHGMTLDAARQGQAVVARDDTEGTLTLPSPLKRERGLSAVREGADGGDSVTAGLSLPGDRASITEKGSVLYFPKVELKWECEGNTGPRGNFNGNHCRLVQDTILSLVNDHPEPVWVQLYLVQGDSPLSEVCDISCPPASDGSCLRECLIEREHSGWNWVDTQMELTPNQPTFWSAFSGQPAGLQPWESLDPGDPPGRPDPDANNPHQRTLRGFVIVWAVDVHGRQIRWNHLTGSTAMIHYEDASSAEYEPWAFPCLSPAVEGGPCGAVAGEINLDGIDYASAPDRLLFDFFAVGSQALSNPQGP